MEHRFNQFQCPLCGRSVSIRKFDPSDFVDDINGIRFEGLGYGRGFGVAEKGSILESGGPVLDLVSDRVLEVSRFLMDAGIITEDMLVSHFPVLGSRAQVKEREELLDDINAALNPYYVDAFDSLFDASEALLKQFNDYEEEDEESEGEHSVGLEDEEEEDFESLSELDKELLLAEREEEEDEDDSLDDEIIL